MINKKRKRLEHVPRAIATSSLVRLWNSDISDESLFEAWKRHGEEIGKQTFPSSPNGKDIFIIRIKYPAPSPENEKRFDNAIKAILPYTLLDYLELRRLQNYHKEDTTCF